MAKIETLPAEVIRKFYATFRMIAPVRVVMKVTNLKSVPENFPSNVYPYVWLPQEKILRQFQLHLR